MWVGIRFPQLEGNLVTGSLDALESPIRFHLDHRIRAATIGRDSELNETATIKGNAHQIISTNVCDIPLGTHTVQERYITAVMTFRDWRGMIPDDSDPNYENTVKNVQIILEYN